ncbi:uncharacterized protein KY384_005417 [Bacidia gigantensis]|uniref:uncharacterized protein n=1 Tax=Bacidia gigantensis TaxID=2732470 RepID=UPI001D03751D|nr:uncharacterized protein KY384_005417 [Bacidia gigantensis]KAG8529936.1 hypothetical protein KY384_005417 [Bacidia gigantensis]
MTPSPAPAHDPDSRKVKPDNPTSSTVAAFSPIQPTASPALKQRSAILVHRKSPLLVATPPTVTRALAFSHPFILPLNQAVGLLTWTSGDAWESFLLVAGFWAIALYGDVALRYAGPLLAVTTLIMLMYSRRYSPLSSSGWAGEKAQDPKHASESSMKHQKSLDEIVETLNIFTTRCNLLLEPFLQLTEFLSTQRTATSATTRPALTSLFIRILLVTPVWIGLMLPPLHVFTCRRVLVVGGTIILSWHSRPARVTRTLLWRSRLVQRILAFVTGLNFAVPEKLTEGAEGQATSTLPRQKDQRAVASSLASSAQAPSLGVRFTFVVYENQRRWLGLGWTYSLLAYERAAWTDEHLNPSDPKEGFQLPEVETGTARWRWVESRDWQVDTGGKSKGGNFDGWIYYDNKWHDGRRGQDGWGRYTRRRKWFRDAELVEVQPGTAVGDSTATLKESSTPIKATGATSHKYSSSKDGDDSSSTQSRRRGLFKRRTSVPSTQSSSDLSSPTTLRNDEDDKHVVPPHHERDGDWDVGDDVRMGLG